MGVSGWAMCVCEVLPGRYDLTVYLPEISLLLLGALLHENC